MAADNFVADFNDFLTMVAEFSKQADAMGRSFSYLTSSKKYLRTRNKVQI